MIKEGVYMSNRRDLGYDSNSDDESPEEYVSKSLINQFALFGRDVLQGSELSTLQKMLRNYQENKHILSSDIAKLLQATIMFYHQTDSEFSNLRDQQFDDEEMIERLNKMADAIDIFDEKLRTPNLTPSERQVITDAANYCEQCIKNRLSELSDANDHLYLLYAKGDNRLKQVMDAFTKTRLKA